MVSACSSLKKLLPGKFAELKEPSLDMGPWAALWVEHPADWGCWCRLMLKTAATLQVVALGVLAAIPEFSLLVHAGLSLAVEEDELLCHDCGRWCRTMVGLTAHRQIVHGDGGLAAMARARVGGSKCPVCEVDFRTRPRLIRHLCHGAKKCVDALKDGSIPVLPVDVVEALNLDDLRARSSRRKSGLRDHAGLLFIRAAPHAEVAVG